MIKPGRRPMQSLSRSILQFPFVQTGVVDRLRPVTMFMDCKPCAIADAPIFSIGAAEDARGCLGSLLTAYQLRAAKK
jgi:hypothetical protein